MTTESTMSLPAIACSVATFWQHVLVSTEPVVGFCRW
ncbi:Uncharacterised protein [Mycobacteroides abscessus]|nr:Uncharacterised protein [Mycobacteroides abscessus]